ncbi:GAF and ANTAR domain-containing protein [Kribbella sp. NBC_01245]|uniref:GAF and ANTAR domain-containing protein n=1 Tax=Kribbella sp. NBC_01245 TaxID=2903578 RepID=UPI002E2B4A49|nr:GAF and ANTAR domain-containing protein [Kribbella sp. NBC_01245]
MVHFDPAEPLAAQTFAELALELHDAPSVEDTVEAVLEFALQAVNCTHAGLTLSSRGRAEIGAVTDPAVESIHQWQIDTGDGPLITSLREQINIGTPDTRADERWPEWGSKIAEMGIASGLQVPLAVGDHTVGVLSLYSTEVDAFSNDDLAVAHILAWHASIAVAAARHQASMVQAIDARKLVGQAMGILMMKFDVDGDRAFAILKRYSQDNNRKLRDVAQEVVDTRKLPH